MINLITALPAEVKPLIRHFSLKHVAGKPFRMWASNQVRLVASGPGKMAAAQAVHFLFLDQNFEEDHAWLNFGICGHRTHRLGTGFIANKITDKTSGRTWYPPPVLKGSFKPASVLTVDQPTLSFRTDDLHEMEASGFYQAAGQCATNELIQCYKIVSDNECALATRVTAGQVELLVADHIKAIEGIMIALERLASQVRERHAVPGIYHSILERWHFTVTEQHQLKRALKQLATIDTSDPMLHGKLNGFDSAKAILTALENKIQSSKPVLS